MLLVAVGAEHQIDFGEIAQKCGKRADRTVKPVVPGEHHHIGPRGAHLRHDRAQRGVRTPELQTAPRQNPLRHLRVGHADDGTANSIPFEKLPFSGRRFLPVGGEHRALKGAHEPEQVVAPEFEIVIAGHPDVVPEEIEQGDHPFSIAVARDRTALHGVAAVNAQRLRAAGAENGAERRHLLQPSVKIGGAENFKLRAGKKKELKRGKKNCETFHSHST